MAFFLCLLLSQENHRYLLPLQVSSVRFPPLATYILFAKISIDTSMYRQIQSWDLSRIYSNYGKILKYTKCKCLSTTNEILVLKQIIFNKHHKTNVKLCYIWLELTYTRINNITKNEKLLLKKQQQQYKKVIKIIHRN